MRTAHDDLRALVFLADFEDVDLDALVHFVFLAGDHFLFGENTVRLAELDICIALFDALYDRCQDLVFLFNVFVIDVAAFRLTDALHHDLLCGLRRDASEILRKRFLFENVAEVVEGVDLLCAFQRDLLRGGFDLFHNGLACVDVVFAGVAVDFCADVRGRIVVALVRDDQRRFKCRQQHGLFDAAFLFQRVQCFDKLCVHGSFLSFEQTS